MTIRTAKTIITNKVFADNGNDYPTSVPYIVYKNGDVVDSGSTVSLSGRRVNKIHEVTLSFDLDDSNLSDGRLFYVEVTLYNVKTQVTIHVEDDEQFADYFTLDDSITIPVPDELDNVTGYKIYRDNELIFEESVQESDTSVTVNLSNIYASIDPLLLLFNSDNSFVDFRVFKITPSVLKAQKDLRSYIDRLNRKMRIDNLKFNDVDYLLWMQAGKDRFNSIPLATDFDMTEATGPIRDMWLVCSQYHALKVKYLEEGLESFDYSGSSVTLSVDITQYLDSIASSLETRITDEGQRLKANIHRRGLISGPGNWGLRRHVVGASGRSISPLTYGIGRSLNRY